MTRFQKLFYDIKHTSDYRTVGENVDYKVFAEHQERKIVLQYEESRVTKPFWHSDWFHNLLFIPWVLFLDGHPVITTFGYACAYKSAKNIPIDEFCALKKLHPDYTTEMWGHSFGSAMVKISARHYYIRNKEPVTNKYTFGDVLCWFNPFIKWIARKYVAFENFEFVTPNDGVTWCVPFYHRTNKCKVGPAFKLKEIFKTSLYHNGYEKYDYSEYEYTDMD